MNEELLQQYVVTANSGKYKSWEEINSKFPELSSYDPAVLQYRAPVPSTVLLLPVVVRAAELEPIDMFCWPLVLQIKAPEPTAVLFVPVVLPYKALIPNAKLLLPERLFLNELKPNAVLLAPV